MTTMAASSTFLITFICTLLYASAAAKWPPPGQACPCTCSVSQDPQLIYALGPGKYKQVDCRDQELREIPSDFPLDTEVVLLSNNNIRSLIQDNLDDIRGLMYLDLSHNFITSIPRDTFTYNSKLRLLNIGWNRVATVNPTSLAPLKQLTRLLMPSNLLTAIPSAVKNLPELSHLDLSKNQIVGIDRTAFLNLPQLQFLNLESNSIRTIDPNVIRQLPQLVNLFLTQNQISYLPTYMFHGLQHLDHIALGKNLIVNLPGIIFRGAPRLRKIDLHQNRLTYLDPQLFRGMRVLELINLNQNKLQNIPPGIFQGLRSLLVLDIAGNPQIRNLPVGIFRGLSFLEEIHISHLQEIPEGLLWGLNNLEDLSITDSTIMPVLGTIFRDTPLLQVLNLFNNGIDVIPDNLFQRMRQLESLNLSSNRLSSFSMAWFGGRTMRNFVALNLQNNQIEELPPEAFVKMPLLQELNLEGNRLDQIQDGLFDSRTQLELLLLSNNKIRIVSEGIIPKLRNVEKLTLTNNKLTCDCHMRSFAEWLLMHVDILESPNEIVCAVPKLYRNRQVIELIESPQNPFTCIFPEIVTRPRHKFVSLNSGSSKEIACQLSDSAVADIIWKLPDATEIKAPFMDIISPIAKRPRFYAKASGSLVLQNVIPADSGVYTCQSLNSVGADEITYEIRVVVPVTLRPTRPKRPTVRPVTGVPNHEPRQTTALPVTVRVPVTPAKPVAPTQRSGGGVAAGGNPSLGGRVTAKIGTSSNRTTLMTFTLPPTTLPPSLCNPNPCKHGGSCEIVPVSSTDSDEEESQESYSSSLTKQQGERIYGTVPGADRYVAECTCRKRWGGPVCQYKKPDMPTQVVVLETDSNLITLTWAARLGDIQGYRILYSKVGDRTIVKSMPIHPQVSSYTMEKLAYDATYRVCVVAFNLGGESPIGEQNCIWAETAPTASGLSSIFNVQLLAIGGGCVVLLVVLVTSLYCYQKVKKNREDETFAEDVIVRRPAPRPHSSASEMIRRSMRRPTASFYSNANDDVMLLDLANHGQRQMYMNPMDSSRHSALFSDLDGSSGGSMAFSDSPRVFPRANARNTLKIQDDTPL